MLRGFDLVWLVPCAVVIAATMVHGETPVAGYEVVHSYPHDSQAFTQGLAYVDGDLCVD